MLIKLSLSLQDAKQLAASAEAVASELSPSVSIAVVDASTYLQNLLRMDGAPPHLDSRIAEQAISTFLQQSGVVQ